MEEREGKGKPLVKTECLTCKEELYLVPSADRAAIARARVEGINHETNFPGHHVVLAIISRLSAK